MCNVDNKVIVNGFAPGLLYAPLRRETLKLFLWEVHNHRFLETLSSTDKLLGHICCMGKVFKIFESQTYLAGHVT